MTGSILERVLTLFAFAVLLVFLGVLIAYVPRLDLGGVILATVLLAGYDLFLHRPPK